MKINFLLVTLCFFILGGCALKPSKRIISNNACIENDNAHINNVLKLIATDPIATKIAQDLLQKLNYKGINQLEKHIIFCELPENIEALFVEANAVKRYKKNNSLSGMYWHEAFFDDDGNLEDENDFKKYLLKNMQYEKTFRIFYYNRM